MANVRKKQTGLPVNIWIDEAETYKKGKHSKFIKFQMDKGLKFAIREGGHTVGSGQVTEILA